MVVLTATTPVAIPAASVAGALTIVTCTDISAPYRNVKVTELKRQHRAPAMTLTTNDAVSIPKISPTIAGRKKNRMLTTILTITIVTGDSKNSSATKNIAISMPDTKLSTGTNSPASLNAIAI
ncbi:MAG: hypothetical protein E7396_09905 [Ruminococcaceae bacterium]|nr:hypothetical protein [Oscillospiraceae bacterium]